MVRERGRACLDCLKLVPSCSLALADPSAFAFHANRGLTGVLEVSAPTDVVRLNHTTIAASSGHPRARRNTCERVQRITSVALSHDTPMTDFRGALDLAGQRAIRGHQHR
jgi:hypothetical protein